MVGSPIVATILHPTENRYILAMSHVWQSADGKQYEIAAKGAPEAIADLCHFTSQQREILAVQVSEMADQGLRVLGVAKASLFDAPPPANAASSIAQSQSFT